MDLYIHDLETLGIKNIIDDYTSLIWTRKYNDVGDFELTAPLSSNNYEALKLNNIIRKEGDDEGGLIESIEIKQDAKGENTIVVKGRSLSCLLNFRVLYNHLDYTGTIENLIYKLVYEMLGDKENASHRAINNFRVITDKNSTEEIHRQYMGDNLGDLVSTLVKEKGEGYKVILNVKDKSLDFILYEGIDRSIDQVLNEVVVFSQEYENILNLTYYKSSSTFCNVAYILGEGEIEEKLTGFSSVDYKNLQRREIYVDGSSIRRENDEGYTYTRDEYMKLLEDRGLEVLAENSLIESLEGTLTPVNTFKYRIDYNLGDIITIVDKKLNLKLNSRIVEVQEVYEGGAESIELTFGSSVPTIYDKLKKIRS